MLLLHRLKLTNVLVKRPNISILTWSLCYVLTTSYITIFYFASDKSVVTNAFNCIVYVFFSYIKIKPLSCLGTLKIYIIITIKNCILYIYYVLNKIEYLSIYIWNRITSTYFYCVICVVVKAVVAAMLYSFRCFITINIIFVTKIFLETCM